MPDLITKDHRSTASKAQKESLSFWARERALTHSNNKKQNNGNRDSLSGCTAVIGLSDIDGGRGSRTPPPLFLFLFFSSSFERAKLQRCARDHCVGCVPACALTFLCEVHVGMCVLHTGDIHNLRSGLIRCTSVCDLWTLLQGPPTKGI